MSIVAQPTEVAYALADANLGPFSTVWFYEQASDVRALLDNGAGAVNVLTGGGVDYTLVGATPLVSGGSVTLSDTLLTDGAWPANARVILQRVQAIDQSSTYGEGLGFSPLASEQALDHVAREVQQVATICARAITLSPGEAGVALPGPTARAGMLLGFDGDGNPVPVAISASGAATMIVDQAGLTLAMGMSATVRSDLEAFGVALPPIASVQEGQGVWVFDGAHNAGMNNITITPAGADLVALWAGTQANFIIDQNSGSAWIERVRGQWRVIPYAAG